MSEYGPSISGVCSGYLPEYYDVHRKKWCPVPWREHPVIRGVPWPMLSGHILAAVSLCGEAQALALAYTYAAHLAADPKVFETPAVRARAWRVEYEIKAKPEDA